MITTPKGSSRERATVCLIRQQAEMATSGRKTSAVGTTTRTGAATTRWGTGGGGAFNPLPADGDGIIRGENGSTRFGNWGPPSIYPQVTIPRGVPHANGGLMRGG